MKSDKRPPWSVNDLWDRYEAERAAHIRQLEIIKKIDDALYQFGTQHHDEAPHICIADLLAWYDNLPEEAP